MNSFISSSSVDSRLKNNIFKKAYLFLMLNWLTFFLTSGIVLLGFLPTLFNLPIVRSQAVQTSPEFFILVSMLFGSLFSFFLFYRAVNRDYPGNLAYMLGFSSFLGWWTTPLFQSIVLLDLAPIVLFAFGAMALLMIFLEILSVTLPKLSINLSILFTLIPALSVLSFLAAWYGFNMIDIVISVCGLIVIALSHLVMLQRTRSLYLKYNDSNEDAVRLATLLFANSYSIFIKILKILMILSNHRRSGKNR